MYTYLNPSYSFIRSQIIPGVLVLTNSTLYTSLNSFILSWITHALTLALTLAQVVRSIQRKTYTNIPALLFRSDQGRDVLVVPKTSKISQHCSLAQTILWILNLLPSLAYRTQSVVTCSRHRTLQIFEFQFSKSLFLLLKGDRKTFFYWSKKCFQPHSNSECSISEAHFWIVILRAIVSSLT